MFYLIEERDGEIIILSQNIQSAVLIEEAVHMAEDNGYIPNIETREELYDRLVMDREYTDGDVTVKIVEKV